MSESRNALLSLLRRLGVAGPADARAFRGTGASARLTNRANDDKITLGNQIVNQLVNYRLGLAVSAALLTLSFGVMPASAAVSHEFLPVPSAEITKGAPEGQSLPGPLQQPVAMTVGSGELFVGERFGEAESSRLDRFDASSGAFVSQAAQVPAPTYLYQGVAVAHATGLVYRGGDEFGGGAHGVVAVFSAAGTLQKVWSGAATPELSFGCFECAGSGDVAVDNNPTSLLGDWAAGDVFVAAPEKRVVDVFKPGVGGTEETAPVKQITGVSPTEPFAKPTAVAVDESDGEVLILDEHVVDIFKPTVLDEYEFAAQITGAPSGSFPGAPVAVAIANGDIYVAVGSVVDQYSSAGAYVGQLTGASPSEPFTNVTSVAVDGADGHVFVGMPGGVDLFGESLVIPEVVTGEATGLSTAAGQATLNGTVNPEELPVTSCEFEYGTEAGKYPQKVPCSRPLPLTGPAAVPVSQTITGLKTATVYHYRLSAANANGLQSYGLDRMFIAPGAGIGNEWSDDVKSTSATLNAEINPNGFPTTYRFEYGETTSYEKASLEEEAGSSGEITVSAHLQDLQAGREYHYRVTAINTLGTIPGPDHTFTTETGGEAGLPDGREWELVSPPDKHGAALFGTEEAVFNQAAADGNGIAYNASTPTEGQPHGNGETTQILATRTGSGWINTDLLVPHTAPSALTNNDAYWAFSADLSSGVLQPPGTFEPALSPEAIEQGAYLRDDTTGLLTPLVTHADDTTSPFIAFGDEENGLCLSASAFCGPAFEGASPDLSHIVLGTGPAGQLPPLLQGAPSNSLYEWSASGLALVSVPPAEPPELHLGGNLKFPGAVGTVSTHAVSNDGSRVFWAENTTVGTHRYLLFVRDMTRGETVEIGGEGAEFQGANAEGTLVFYSGHECEVRVGETGLECRPIDGANKLPLEDGHVLTTSEDGAWVYYQQGENIYVRHANEEPRLVASNIGNISSAAGLEPQHDPWRASPNGEWFAFMSDSPLTGYDNHDATTGQPDEEVYLYSTAAGGRLVCASCDPTGARPHGTTAVHLKLADYSDIMPSKQSIAATIPGWAPYKNGRAVYDPRFLSNEGRLFFNAVDGLVPKDVNGQVDTYELEPPGVGSCTTTTQTGSDIYVPAAAGCIALISNGESPEESVFQDASETGEDIFFLSSSHLSTADLDGSISMWDAHECTTANPCLPPPPSPSPACETEASCKASPTPQPAIYAPPASATFTGPGNLAPVAGSPKTETRAQKLTKALAQCHKDRAKKKRTKCEAAAKQKYGPAKKAKKSAHRSAKGRK
jgi:hypothetical protein